MIAVLLDVFLPQVRFTYADMLRQCHDAEDAGFDSLWFMDHLMAEGRPEWNCLEGWTLAAAVAAQTTRIRLGHLVLCNGFRHPSVLAKMATTLDDISGGRLDLGIGWGSVPRELKVYGFGKDGNKVKAARLDETLQILKLMFGGGEVSFEGEHYYIYKAHCVPGPVNGTIPIMIGGAGPQLTMPLVAKYADWWNCPANAVSRLDELVTMRGNARISVQHILAIAPTAADREEATRVADKRFGFWGGGILAGTPDEIIEALQGEQKLGAERFIFRFHDFGSPESYRLFTEEIAPALRT